MKVIVHYLYSTNSSSIPNKLKLSLKKTFYILYIFFKNEKHALSHNKDEIMF